ncbi:hypothetical protein J7E93_08070 [Streptomyces sp. ISL-36]|uniref:hypothetical protein n=1 Tax=Streptomyces sp. ISL-36 TaxID=2819182 RepID=UPI001BE6350A|nr:hypothetical protein [Streptomyces sp. ISL-36]MBT2440075.1 hypothetical protein [Streptomyces sp. ISL-36]
MPLKDFGPAAQDDEAGGVGLWLDQLGQGGDEGMCCGVRGYRGGSLLEPLVRGGEDALRPLLLFLDPLASFLPVDLHDAEGGALRDVPGLADPAAVFTYEMRVLSGPGRAKQSVQSMRSVSGLSVIAELLVPVEAEPAIPINRRPGVSLGDPAVRSSTLSSFPRLSRGEDTSCG